MKLKAQIQVNADEKDIKNISKCFEPELDNIKRDRSGFTINKKKETLQFDITAKDSTALRATLNSISKLLTVYEKTSRVE